VELYGSLVHVFSGDVKKQQREITSLLKKNGIESGHTAIIEPSLEDIFIACMKEGLQNQKNPKKN
jgi:hypothetical protein